VEEEEEEEESDICAKMHGEPRHHWQPSSPRTPSRWAAALAQAPLPCAFAPHGAYAHRHPDCACQSARMTQQAAQRGDLGGDNFLCFTHARC
jgi:hypothetical protein